MQSPKPTLAVYKFASCDGCQLAFLNLGSVLLELAALVDIVHFPEMGVVNLEAAADITFVEGSVSAPEHLEQIKVIREQSQYLITIGACATAGGIQALRNFADVNEWVPMIYAKPAYIKTLTTSTPIAKHVRVDLELWGCPVNSEQILSAIKILLRKVTPRVRRDSVCIQCKQAGNVCVLVAKGEPCLGPVTQTGCGALCPSVGRDCYGCYGPDENPNTYSLSRRFAGLGLMPAAIARRFLFINNQAPAFHQAGQDAANEE